MLNKLKGLFSTPKNEATAAKPSPQFEVLIPKERPPSEEPKMVARMLSYLYAAPAER